MFLFWIWIGIINKLLGGGILGTIDFFLSLNMLCVSFLSFFSFFLSFFSLFSLFFLSFLPLDVFVLDMDWHYKQAPWGGYTWDHRLFPFPEYVMRKFSLFLLLFFFIFVLDMDWHYKQAPWRGYTWIIDFFLSLNM